MTIDLEKVKELEQKYSHNSVALDTFHRMIHIVFEEPQGQLPGGTSAIYSTASVGRFSA